MQIECSYNALFDGGWDVHAVRSAVSAARRAVVVSHTNADGDAVGSLLGMCRLLHNAGVPEVTPMLPDGCPNDLIWLPNTGIILSGKTQLDDCRKAIAAADFVVGVDISGLERTGCLAEPLRASQGFRMLVDHHLNPARNEFSIVVSEPEISSACELVYWLMQSSFGSQIFDRDSATCLYTGLCTDTGNFSFSNDRQSLYLAAANLLTFGIDPMWINRSIKNVFTVPRFKFFAYAMAHRLTVYPQQQVALMVLTDKDMSDAGVESHELTGLINEVMKLKDIDCGILIREEHRSNGGELKIRLSLRSKEHYDVNLLAGELFGGGGHKRAAGATSTVSLEETVKIVKQKLHLEDC
ncbi:MAG: DHH family phosphoesterase [Bacteroidales bacterium]|nr:DHH family phosphoesterase [Bacteroidales bacterium]